jgi:hypothetical protein
MRKLVLGIALGLGALGIMAATPASAKAFWIMTARGPVNVSGYNLGAFGVFNAYGAPAYRPIITPWGIASNYYYPGGYHFSYTPTSVSSIYTSPSMLSYSYNAWYGYLLSVSSPAYVGYSYSPYMGYRPFAIPSVSYTMPASSSYYSGYVPPGYLGSGY